MFRRPGRSFMSFRLSKIYIFSAMEGAKSGEAVDVPVEKPKTIELLHLPFPSEPSPVKILQPVEETHTFLFNADALEHILCDPKYANKRVCGFEALCFCDCSISFTGVGGRRGGKVP